MIDPRTKPQLRQITVQIDYADPTPLKIWAEVVGTMAVHRSPGGKYWVVTHVGSGLRVTQITSRARALHVACMLGDLVPAGVAEGGRAPKWVDPEKEKMARKIMAAVNEED